MNLDKIPYNLEAEQSVLGSLLLNKEAIYKVIDFLDKEDFYSEQNKIIYSSYLEMFKVGDKIDVVTFSEKLTNQNLIDKIGGRSYLVQLMNLVPSANHVIDYATVVKDKSLRRKMLIAQFENESEIYNEEKEINNVIANVQSRLYEINPLKTRNNSIQSILKDLESLQDEYSKKYAEGKKIIGYSSGYEKLDNAIDGLRPGHLWVIGAWHGTGKTSFALNIIHNLLEQNVPTSIITTEMSQVDLTAKLIGIRHTMTSMKVIRGKLEKEQFERIEEAKLFFGQTNLEIHTEFDYEKITMQIRKDVYTRGVKVVMIDYIQKITHGKIYEETPLMARIAQGLSNLAQDLKITIILLSQISNDAQKGSGAGAGYKGSGAIEASADLALVLKRDKTKESGLEARVPLKVQITKNKFGFDGIFEYYLHLESGQVTINNLI